MHVVQSKVTYRMHHKPCKVQCAEQQRQWDERALKNEKQVAEFYTKNRRVRLLNLLLVKSKYDMAPSSGRLGSKYITLRIIFDDILSLSSVTTF